MLTTKINRNWKTKFFSIWIGQAFSLLGSEIVQFSLIWYLTRETGSAVVLAISTFVSLLPNVFLAPFIGALVDRWDRRKIMIIADLSIATVTSILGVLFFFDIVQIWHIYLIMFLRAIGGVFHWPSMRASTALLVPKENMARIAGANQSLRGLMTILGPPLAALLLEVLPFFSILAIDIVTAILASLPLFFVVIPNPAEQKQEKIYSFKSLLDDVKSGLKYLWNWKGMFLLTMTATILNFLLNPGFSLLPLLIKEHFFGGAWELSIIESIFGVGVILGGLLLGIWGGFRKKVHTLLIGLVGMGIGITLIAAAPSNLFIMALFGMGITGLLNPIANGSIQSIMMAKVNPEMQGRVFTSLSSLASAMSPLGMLVAAPVAELIGIRGWLYFGGFGCLLMGISGFFIHSIMNVEDEKI